MNAGGQSLGTCRRVSSGRTRFIPVGCLYNSRCPTIECSIRVYEFSIGGTFFAGVFSRGQPSVCHADNFVCFQGFGRLAVVLSVSPIDVEPR